MSELTLRFHVERDRQLFFAPIGNGACAARGPFDPRIAIVGLSPGKTQLASFISKYRTHGDFDRAARDSAFEGLSRDIVEMLNGLGVSDWLGLGQLSSSLDLNTDGRFLTTSLVKCASLTLDGKSTDFDPVRYESNRLCIARRFLSEISEERFPDLKVVIGLGSKVRSAFRALNLLDGGSLESYLTGRGRIVAYLPHPSGENKESVDLAKLSRSEFPTVEEHAMSKWRTYVSRPAKKGTHQPQATYMKTRRTRWSEIAAIRKQFL